MSRAPADTKNAAHTPSSKTPAVPKPAPPPPADPAPAPTVHEDPPAPMIDPAASSRTPGMGDTGSGLASALEASATPGPALGFVGESPEAGPHAEQVFATTQGAPLDPKAKVPPLDDAALDGFVRDVMSARELTPTLRADAGGRNWGIQSEVIANQAMIVLTVTRGDVVKTQSIQAVSLTEDLARNAVKTLDKETR